MTTAAPPRTPVRPARRPTQRGTIWVLFGSLASGLGAYAFQVIGVRALGEVAYQPITVLWTLQYLLMTIALYSAEAYVARTTVAHRGDDAALDRPVRLLGLWVGALAVLTTGITWLLRDALFAGAGDLALVTGLLVAGYGSFFIIKGRMAGVSRFRSYGAATALESIGRVLVAAPVLLLVPSTRALAWTMPVGAAAVAVWWFYDRGRAIATVPTGGRDGAAPELPEASTGRYLAATTVANAASQTLLAAGPLALLALGAGPSEVSVFFVTVTAARVPLVFAYGGVLSRVLPPLMRLADEGKVQTLRRLTLACALVAAALAGIGALAGELVGPPLVAFFFGESARPGADFVALTVAGVVLATGALLINQVLVARRAEARLPLPWLLGLGVAVVVMLLAGGSATIRVSLGFVVGEVVAVCSLVATVWTLRTPPRAAQAPR